MVGLQSLRCGLLWISFLKKHEVWSMCISLGTQATVEKIRWILHDIIILRQCRRRWRRPYLRPHHTTISTCVPLLSLCPVLSPNNIHLILVGYQFNTIFNNFPLHCLLNTRLCSILSLDHGLLLSSTTHPLPAYIPIPHVRPLSLDKRHRPAQAPSTVITFDCSPLARH